MALRFETLYRIVTGKNLGDPETWNVRFRDIDRRIDANERALEDVDAVANRVEAVALERLDNVITPLVEETQGRIQNLSTMFQADSLTSVTVGTGEKTFTVIEGQRNTFAVVEWVSVYARQDATAGMIGRVVSFDRATGVLVVDAQVASGSGTFADWRISVSAPVDLDHAARTDNPHGVTPAQIGTYTATEIDTARAAGDDAVRADLRGGVGATWDTLKKLYDWAVLQLAGKSNNGHGHVILDVENLQATLNAKAETTDVAASYVKKQSPSLSDANTLVGSGFYATPAEFPGSVYDGAAAFNQGVLLHQDYSADYSVQIFQPMQASQMFHRHRNLGVWSEWSEVFHGFNGVGGRMVAFQGVGTHTFVVPVGVHRVWGRCIGGGGSGASVTSQPGGGGGGGGVAEGVFDVVPGETLTIVVGTGGQVNAANMSGNSGGPTYIQRPGPSTVIGANGGSGGSWFGPGGRGGIGYAGAMLGTLGAGHAGGPRGVDTTRGIGGNGGGSDAEGIYYGLLNATIRGAGGSGSGFDGATSYSAGAGANGIAFIMY